ncbi:hypothetical protein [Carnobacterium sp.]|uniref:hypothetical protein n=1 Tax=Carnobacterium sp. TaxID=48221 RepID=UPI0028AD26BD|nr:hypothetical protein [Carnobacterium sp.]
MKNPKMNKRNKLPLLLGILLLISAAAYGTRAYFTDSATEQAGIKLELGNVKIENKSTAWTYNEQGQAKFETQDEGKVLYTNVSGGDSFTKHFIFKNTGSLVSKIKLEQDIVKEENANPLVSEDKVYSYDEGPYTIKITSDKMNFIDLINGAKLESGETLDIQMEISLNPDLNNEKYNRSDKDGGNLDGIALDLLENKVTVELTDLAKK